MELPSKHGIQFSDGKMHECDAMLQAIEFLANHEEFAIQKMGGCFTVEINGALGWFIPKTWFRNLPSSALPLEILQDTYQLAFASSTRTDSDCHPRLSSIPSKHYTLSRRINSMKVFNGKQAAQDYMSSHTLAFSTPELTLMRYSFWLADMIPDPKDKSNTIPRMMSYVEERDFAPVEIIDEEHYEPTGAVRNTGMYGNVNKVTDSNVKFCSECGARLSVAAKFCTECGTTQD